MIVIDIKVEKEREKVVSLIDKIDFKNLEKNRKRLSRITNIFEKFMLPVNYDLEPFLEKIDKRYLLFNNPKKLENLIKEVSNHEETLIEIFSKPLLFFPSFSPLLSVRYPEAYQSFLLACANQDLSKDHLDYDLYEIDIDYLEKYSFINSSDLNVYKVGVFINLFAPIEEAPYIEDTSLIYTNTPIDFETFVDFELLNSGIKADNKKQINKILGKIKRELKKLIVESIKEEEGVTISYEKLKKNEELYQSGIRYAFDRLLYDGIFISASELEAYIYLHREVLKEYAIKSNKIEKTDLFDVLYKELCGLVENREIIKKFLYALIFEEEEFYRLIEKTNPLLKCNYSFFISPAIAVENEKNKKTSKEIFKMFLKHFKIIKEADQELRKIPAKKIDVALIKSSKKINYKFDYNL